MNAPAPAYGDELLHGASRAEAVHVGHEIAEKRRRAAYERTHGALKTGSNDVSRSA